MISHSELAQRERLDLLRTLGLYALLLVFLPFTHTTARAQVADLRYDLKLDLPVTGAAVGWLLVSELSKSELAAASCRWCSVNGFDRSARSALRWHDTQLANVLSQVSGYGLAPVAVLGTLALVQTHDDALHEFPIDLMIIAEAAFISQSLNQVVKFSTGRERPFVHALAEVDKPHTAHPDDNNTSFFSGHTNMTFSLAVAAGTVASMRGYRWATSVWIVGLAAASLTGYLRIAADRHYLSDVLTGATVGSALGFALPYVFHNREPQLVRISTLPHGVFVSACWSN